MGDSIFSIGISGLNAAQAGLLTTSHNISNVNTPGYSRQQALQSSAAPHFTGAGYIGQGTRIDSVRRIYDEFLTTHVRQTQSVSSHQDIYAAHADSLDAIFGDARAGLTPVLSDFFAGINAVANNPADIPSRQALLGAAQSLAGRFHDIAGQLAEIRSGVNTQIASAVDDVNRMAASLARLNDEIGLASDIGGSGRPPNDLLDQRDQLLADLNTQIGATAVKQSDGSLNVYLGNGEPLVVGYLAYKLTAFAGNDDPQNLEVGLDTGTATVTFRPGDLSGGVLGGLFDYRANVLDAADDRLGSIALAVADGVNKQHALGQDLNGNPGGAFFTLPTPYVQGALANTGTATMSVGIASSTALAGSNYELSFNGASYTLTRLSDQTSQSFASLPQTVDGLTIGLASGAPAAGDSFLIQPARHAASDLAVALRDVREIAAAAPVRTSFSLSNAGTATISPGSVDANYLAAPLASPLTLTFNAGMLTGFPLTQAVTVTNGATVTTYAAGAPVPYTAGATLTFGGISIVVDGAPADSDTFTVAPNTGGVGDGRNALALRGLATRANVVNGSASLTAANAQLTSFVGTAAHGARVAADAGGALLAQAKAAQQSASGVNLDEEAANLQRYQQAYQAAGKVMAIANTLFETLLAIANN